MRSARDLAASVSIRRNGRGRRNWARWHKPAAE
jgi:hypothetical protein